MSPSPPQIPQIPSYPGVSNELLQDPRLIQLYQQLLQAQQTMQTQAQPQFYDNQLPSPLQNQPTHIPNAYKSPTKELKMFKDIQQVRRI